MEEREREIEQGGDSKERVIEKKYIEWERKREREQRNWEDKKKRKKKNIYPYLPTPPLGQDMIQGQFLSGV